MKIFYNGKIYRNDGAPNNDSAMLIDNGKIIKVGSDAEILSYCTQTGEEPDRTDLKGQLVMPGFVDSHLHFLEYAYEKSFVDLSKVKSLEEMQELLKDKLSEAKAKNQPLRGTGFNHNYWIKTELPSREDLDRVSEDMPIIIRRACHHITVCNTPALLLSGLVSRCPDGILREEEQNILEEALPPLSLELVKELIIEASKDVLSVGITEIQTDDLSVISSELYGRTIIDAYMEIDREGLLPIRVYEQCNLPTKERLKAFLDAGYMTGYTTGNFTIGPLKLLGDGALGAKTAAVMKPYPEDEGNCGMLNFTDEEMFELIDMANRAGMQIAVHGIGDRCIEQIVNSFEKSLSGYPRENHRHGIVHCQITHHSQLERMKAVGLMAYIQPIFIKADRHIVEERVGAELAASSYDWRKMLDMGIHLGAGSDCPVEPFDILPNMYYAVKRKDAGQPDGWFPEKNLSLEEAINLFTTEGAYASFSEKTRGKLITGYTADFCVIDRDITSMGAEALNDAKVTMTVVGGEVKYADNSIPA